MKIALRIIGALLGIIGVFGAYRIHQNFRLSHDELIHEWYFGDTLLLPNGDAYGLCNLDCEWVTTDTTHLDEALKLLAERPGMSLRPDGKGVGTKWQGKDLVWEQEGKGMRAWVKPYVMKDEWVARGVLAEDGLEVYFPDSTLGVLMRSPEVLVQRQRLPPELRRQIVDKEPGYQAPKAVVAVIDSQRCAMFHTTVESAQGRFERVIEWPHLTPVPLVQP